MGLQEKVLEAYGHPIISSLSMSIACPYASVSDVFKSLEWLGKRYMVVEEAYG